MKTMKLRTLVAAMVVAFAPLASQGQTAAGSTDIDKQTTLLNATAENKGQAQVATKIASSFTHLAGSDENALKLVQALRSGSKVTLTAATSGTGTPGTGTGTTTSFTPPTGKMGWGNVFNSLALAQNQLTQLGITNPTQEQLQAALVGGDVTVDGKTTTLKGILTLRADGMGWGNIAKETGTKLGPVVSSIRSTQHTVAALAPATGDGSGTTSTPTAGATTKASAKGVTTANGGSTSVSSKGVSTAAGTAGPGHSSKGITTAGGATSSGSASRGLVTAGGASAGSLTHGNSANAPGKGIVTAAGSSAGAGITHGNSGNKGGAGLVTAGGSSAASVTTAANNAGGSGKGNAGGNGKGKGGG
jgi:hypothetical protein